MAQEYFYDLHVATLHLITGIIVMGQSTVHTIISYGDLPLPVLQYYDSLLPLPVTPLKSTNQIISI